MVSNAIETDDPFAAPSASNSSASKPKVAKKPESPQLAPNIFITPKKGSAPKAVNGTTFEYAPSPSKLRDMIASHAGIASPNARPPSVAARLSPVKGSNPFARPADTPRTKARKWLSGSVPVSPAKAAEASNWKKAFTAGAAEMEEDAKSVLGKAVNAVRSDAPELVEEMDTVMDDGLGPSPVKAINGKVRSFRALFDEPKPVEPALKQFKLTFGKDTFLPPSAPANPKKRQASVAQSVSFVDPKTTEAQPAPRKAKKPRLSKPKASTSQIEEDDEEEHIARPHVPTEDGGYMIELEDAEGNYRPIKIGSHKPWGSKKSRTTEEGEEDEWEWDDEYVPASFPGQDPTRDVEMIEEDRGLPEHLAQLLSLGASPTKKHRHALANQKRLLVQQVLQEPSLHKRDKAEGLQDLEDEEEQQSENEEERDERLEELPSDDDDWDSDPEGWKGLGVDADLDF